MAISKGAFFAYNFAFRMVLIYVAHLVDTHSPHAKYTDTDYLVFSDAATHVYNGRSPFERHTYRYTPLVAYVALVNNYIHPLAAKVVFCICDILVGMVLWQIIQSQIPKGKNTIYYVAFLLLNPLIFILSTRGSNDNMISLLVFTTIYFLLKR
jgi:phosphatidylinositol glycan class M